MRTFKADYNLGTKNEIMILPKLINYFKRDIVKTNGMYDKFDFKDDEYFYELKTRTNTYKSYPTTLIPFDKIEDGKKIILLFNFTDGLYYIEYNKMVFDTFEKKEFKRGYRYDINDIKKDYYFIPIEYLISII
jgi:hypothetical protein